MQNSAIISSHYKKSFQTKTTYILGIYGLNSKIFPNKNSLYTHIQNFLKKCCNSVFHKLYFVILSYRF